MCHRYLPHPWQASLDPLHSPVPWFHEAAKEGLCICVAERYAGMQNALNRGGQMSRKVRDMEHRLVIRYILFAFAPDPMSDASRIVAALTLSLESPTPQLNVYERPGWAKSYQSESALQLAKDTLADWKTLRSEEVEEVFGVLVDASMGPLRAERNGSATQTDLKKILADELEVEI